MTDRRMRHNHPTYIPLARRFSKVMERWKTLTSDANLTAFKTLVRLSETTERSPQVLLNAFVGSVLVVLLINPDNIAPFFSNFMSLSCAALATLAHLKSLETGTKNQLEDAKLISMRLLDFWVCLSFTTTIEQVTGTDVITYLFPLWWSGKATVAMTALLVMLERRGGENGKPRPLTLVSRNRDQITWNDTEPEVEPEDVQDEALTAGPPRSTMQTQQDYEDDLPLSSGPVPSPGMQARWDAFESKVQSPQEHLLSGTTLVDSSIHYEGTGDDSPVPESIPLPSAQDEKIRATQSQRSEGLSGNLPATLDSENLQNGDQNVGLEYSSESGKHADAAPNNHLNESVTRMTLDELLALENRNG